MITMLNSDSSTEQESPNIANPMKSSKIKFCTSLDVDIFDR